MSEFGLDDALVERLVSEMERELDRDGPPADFPRFHDIPAGRYTSEEFYELEQRYLWPKSWACVGRVEDLPEVGSYVLFDELGPPLIVVRGRDDVIRCFSNTCMHRGAPVVREPVGRVRNLRCQYHAWTYSITDGELLTVTDERDFVGLCKADKGLPEIRCETWGGWVWVNMNPDAKPLIEFLGPVAVEMEQFQPESLRLVHSDERVIDCNWKVAVDAFLEVYHFRFIHDRDGFSLLDAKGATSGLFSDGNSRIVAPFSEQAVARSGRTSWKDLRVLPNPYGLDPIPTVHPLVHCSVYSFTVFPNVIINLIPSGFPMFAMVPDGPGRTKIRIRHYAPELNACMTEAWRTRIDFFDQIMDEDVENMDPMNRAMSSPLYPGVPISYQERRIWHMNETIDRVIGVERIPEELRVAQLLGPFLETD